MKAPAEDVLQNFLYSLNGLHNADIVSTMAGAMIYTFGNCTLDVGRRELRYEEDLVSVEPQVLDLLQYLVKNGDRVVSKDDLIANVWNGRIVSDSTLTSRISAARRAIGDSGGNQRLIRTISRKGFRFVGEIRADGGPGGASSARTDAAEVREEAILPSVELEAPRLPDQPSIAVMPFTNMSGDPGQEYFSDGITEDVITGLSRLRWFFVIARNSTFTYKGQPTEVRQVGRTLGVRYILEGSVRKSGERMRVTAQLIDAVAGCHIWAERYDRELTEVFALQDAITESVVASVEPRLLAAEGIRTRGRSVEDLGAWDLVARALSHFWTLRSAESEAAIAILRQAVDRHPTYAPAHSLLAFALLVAAHMGWPPSGDHRDYVERLARRAFDLDERDPWAQMALGYLGFSRRQTAKAVHHFRTAIELNPGFAGAYGYMGWALAHDWQSVEAIQNLQQAIRMSPHDPFNVFYMAGLAAAHYLEGRYTVAAEWARKAIQLRPGHLGARRKLCASLAQAGLDEEAASELAQLRELQPGISIAWIKQAVPYTPKPMAHFLEGMRKAGLADD